MALFAKFRVSLDRLLRLNRTYRTDSAARCVEPADRYSGLAHRHLREQWPAREANTNLARCREIHMRSLFFTPGWYARRDARAEVIATVKLIRHKNVSTFSPNPPKVTPVAAPGAATGVEPLTPSSETAKAATA